MNAYNVAKQGRKLIAKTVYGPEKVLAEELKQ